MNLVVTVKLVEFSLPGILKRKQRYFENNTVFVNLQTLVKKRVFSKLKIQIFQAGAS